MTVMRGHFRGLSSLAADAALLLHNPNCSKSRGALALLTDSGFPFFVRNYLTKPLSAAELAALAQRLRSRPTDWMRQSEPEWAGRFGGPPTPVYPSDDACLRAIEEAPSLLERPIFVHGPSAVVGRPPELVLALAGSMPNAAANVRYAVCEMDEHGEYDRTLVETASEEGAHRLVQHLKSKAPDDWSWPEHHMIRRVDSAREFKL